MKQTCENCEYYKEIDESPKVENCLWSWPHCLRYPEMMRINEDIKEKFCGEFKPKKK